MAYDIDIDDGRIDIDSCLICVISRTREHEIEANQVSRYLPWFVGVRVQDDACGSLVHRANLNT